MIKVAMSQRICPVWRLPLFREIAGMEDIDFTLYFGEGKKYGSAQNAKEISGFKYKKLFTIPMSLSNERYRAFHPTIFFHLIKGHYDVVIVEPSTNFFDDVVIFFYCKLFGKKMIWFYGAELGNKSFYRRLIDPVQNAMIRRANGFITYHSGADQYLLGLGVERYKLYRAQNTIDTKEILENKEEYLQKIEDLNRCLELNSYAVVIYIGAIEKRKRIENLISAILLLARQGIKVKLLIVGDGEYETELKAKILPEQSQNIVFLGRHVADAPVYILASKVVVLPGQGGLTVNHALACGRPCITTEEAEGPGIHDYIKDGVNGYVVPSNDIPSLAEAIEKVVSDKGLWEKLCEGADLMGKQLTIYKMAQGFRTAILNVCKIYYEDERK